MLDALNEAAFLCKTMFRNGYDAHVINAPLQQTILKDQKKFCIDLACEAPYPILVKIFRDVKPAPEDVRYIATLEQDGVLYRFYRLSTDDSAHPELAQIKYTPTMFELFTPELRKHFALSGLAVQKETGDQYQGFEALSTGQIMLSGIPDETLRNNYILAIRALRFAANFDLPIEENTRLAIIRASARVLDYVPAREIMDEWRKVAAESMYAFVQLLFDVHLLHGLMPEIAALCGIKHTRNKKTGEVETIFEHTIKCMKYYPEGNFHHDWLGTMAMLFHDVGKLYTAEYIDGDWTFYQHHRVGAQVTRKILRRLHFSGEDTELICHLVRCHMRFHVQLTDRGIRRFMALNEYPRIIEMYRADVKARDATYTNFNHNMKYLTRAETPEQMLEPLLNGNEIMQVCKLAPGPMVGLIRDALLQAQISGEVTDVASAKDFVVEYAKNQI